MFKKNKCPNCKKKIEERYSFCPYCGEEMGSDLDDEDFGMLGKDDFISPMNEIKLPMGLNTIFNSLMKNLSKEMEAELHNSKFNNKNIANIKKDGISISISTFGNNPPKIKVTPLGQAREIKPQKKIAKFKQIQFDRDRIKSFSKLEKAEPKTEIRRLSNKVIYELEMPGVKSLEDVSILKLENSIEIKAISKDKAYSKLIQISLPIESYDLSNGKLILELGVKN